MASRRAPGECLNLYPAGTPKDFYAILNENDKFTKTYEATWNADGKLVTDYVSTGSAITLRPGLEDPRAPLHEAWARMRTYEAPQNPELGTIMNVQVQRALYACEQAANEIFALASEAHTPVMDGNGGRHVTVQSPRQEIRVDLTGEPPMLSMTRATKRVYLDEERTKEHPAAVGYVAEYDAKEMDIVGLRRLPGAE